MSLFHLKNVLIADAITCAVMFLLCVLATAAVSALLGLPPALVAIAGWICLASALLMLTTAFRQPVSAGLVHLIAFGNLGWVAASAGVLSLYWGTMAWPGALLVAGQAIVVLIFALLEMRGAAALPRAARV
ncbi:MAG: hypothetical protein U0S50_04845 [Sphingopyxis sp.]|uniref:hypothetical protein n=1 Tax=Sphingopyxis sp. TaxID=1908224 RepID=UPI002AB8BAD3|nr:hypothetical protein [Sphingopyxis sp.]MDZ3831129.1 hypothetical protein [Sphingopyxis sp.]